LQYSNSVIPAALALALFAIFKANTIILAMQDSVSLRATRINPPGFTETPNQANIANNPKPAIEIIHIPIAKFSVLFEISTLITAGK